MSKSEMVKGTALRSLLGCRRHRGHSISCLGVVAVTLLGATAQAQDTEAELEALELEAAGTTESVGADTAASAETPAVEQDASAAPAEPAAEAKEQRADFDEVVVTVDRRKKSLQDYSGIASAFSEDKLSSVGVNNVRELSQMVPGLQIGTQESGTTIYIRGIGSDNNTELGDPAVAVHMDGVYLPRSRGMGSAFFDIERVEVNSGPQGTLRGRNAVGGSINIVSKQPKLGQYEASASATVGSYDLRRFQGMVNIPFGESAALRVAGQSNTHDSYWENAGPVNHIPGAQNADDYAMRATFLWKPVEEMNVTLGYDLITESGTGYLGANMQQLLVRTDDTDPDNVVPDPYDVESIEDPRRVALRGRVPNQTLVHQGGRIHIDYDTGPAIVEFSGSYRDLVYKQYNGSNAGVVVPDEGLDREMDNWSGSNQWDNRSKSTTLELRAYSPDDAQLKWSLGGFYFYEDQGAFLGQMNDPFGGYGGGEFNMPSTVGRSYAAFADATFSVTEDFRIIGGARYSNDHKDRLDGLWALWNNLDNSALPEDQAEAAGLDRGGLGRYGTEGFSYKGYDRQNYTLAADASVEDRVNFFLDGIKSFGVRDQVPISLCNDVPLDENGDPGERLFVNDDGNLRCTAGVRDSVSGDIFTAVPQNNEVDTSYIDFRAGVEYDLAKDNLLYATVTSGHKAAGFNDTQNLSVNTPLFNSDYGQETVYSAELGSKNVLFDRKLKVNGAAFAFLYGGMQFQTIVSVGDPPPLDEFGNVAIDPATGEQYEDMRSGTAVRQNAQEDTLVYGLDLDVIYSLPAGLEAEVHALLMDARFTDGTYVNDSRLNLGALNAQVDLGGNWLPRASPYTINYALSQVMFTEIGQLDWQVQAQTRGKHYMTVFNGNGDGLVQPGPDWQTEDIEANAGYQGLVANPARLLDRVNTYTTVNAGIGWRHPDGRLSIRGFVNNVFNTTYANTIIATGGLNLRFFNNQRMGGATVRMDW